MISSSQVRRLEFEIATLTSADPAEAAVEEAASYAASRLGLSLNFAILKWYKKSDAYRSEAYRPHIDPPEFRGIPLVLGTLYGRARLTVWLPSGEQKEVIVAGNDFVLLNPNLIHKVSEPLNEDGTRYYMFLGQKQQTSS